MSPSMGLSVIKTWCNGWVTDSRVGADASPCRFGCDKGHDRLQHYLTCPMLSGQISKFLNSVSQETIASIHQRACLDPAGTTENTTNKIIACAIAVETYQLVAASQRKNAARFTKDTLGLHEQFFHYVREAGERALSRGNLQSHVCQNTQRS